MKRPYLFVFVVCALAGASLGCFATGKARPLGAEELGERNRRRLARLELGMSRDEVVEIMGSDTVFGYSGEPNLENPHSTEAVHDREGRLIEVLFFRTATSAWDGTATTADLTPLSFHKGRLVGRGWAWLEKNVQKYRP